ncbi:hypothetical protein Ocin01_02489 [Orchesella cincta]|uniref:Uncharacterized protein n=1 Tax=Orchesella cincta TaxID=48709 RepID=A0A1D2NFU6_ORCCI|nr:hypothetical protein Ocin01_02489 [Orchesella cincta]
MSGQQKNTEVAMLKFKVFGQDYIQFYFRVRVNVPMMIVKKSIAAIWEFRLDQSH